MATESNSMEAAIYRAAMAGDMDGLTTALQQDPELNLLNQLTPRDDTILHIAASLGHDHLVKPIQSRCPDLFKSKNCNDDHPLHLAAAGGHLSIVESLITNAFQFAISSGRASEAGLQEVLNVIKGQNKQGNTPLHLAVAAGHLPIAKSLFMRAASPSCFPNLEKKSPLYMAAEAGYLELFELMMQYVASNVDAQNMLKDSEPLLHVAITTRNKVDQEDVQAVDRLKKISLYFCKHKVVRESNRSDVWCTVMPPTDTCPNNGYLLNFIKCSSLPQFDGSFWFFLI